MSEDINSLEMSLILISDYNQTYQTYRLVICVYILLCVMSSHQPKHSYIWMSGPCHVRGLYHLFKIQSCQHSKYVSKWMGSTIQRISRSKYGSSMLDSRCFIPGVAKPLPGGKKVPAKTFSSAL